MLTLQLGKHLIHALAFSPDGTRLAVACGRKVTCLDWQAPGEPAWHEPATHTQGCAIWLAFRHSANSVLAGYGNPRYRECRSVLDFDLAGGLTVESLSLRAAPGLSWPMHSPMIVNGADPTSCLATAFRTGHDPWHSFVVSMDGQATGVLAKLPATTRVQIAPSFVSPKAAWVVRQDRLLVWTEGYLSWFRWPPPQPAPPPSLWRMFASALTGSRPPLPPALQLIAEFPFPNRADAVAPLPDGETVLVAWKDKLLRWHAPTGTELARWRLPGMQALRSLAVSPDGTVAAVGGNDGRVVIWDLDV